MKNGGFVCSVSGKRRGKGSSREQSPYAEMCAGIQVVIAENIERIYKQNCQNLGLLTSTNFSLIDRIRAGEDIALSEFTAGEDEITRQVIEYGGLFPFNVARMQKKVFLPPITCERAFLPATAAGRNAPNDAGRENLRQPHAHRRTARSGVPAVKPGDTGFTRVDLRFSHEYVTPMASIFYEHYVGKDVPVNDASTIRFFRDHLTFLDEVISEEKKKMGLLDLATQLKLKQDDFARQQGIKLHGELTDRKGSEGICHSVMLETYALPGQVNVGSDSHTPHVGAIGCIAFGIGTTDVFNSWITKDVRVKIPESVKIIIRGKRHPNVTAKDFILKILSLDYVRSGQALAKVMEYAGEAVEALSVDERATMTNMAAEIGGFTGIVAPDEKVVEFLIERRSGLGEQLQNLGSVMRSGLGEQLRKLGDVILSGTESSRSELSVESKDPYPTGDRVGRAFLPAKVDEVDQLKTELRQLVAPLHSDPDAEYAHVIELDAAEITTHGRHPRRPRQRQIHSRSRKRPCPSKSPTEAPAPPAKTKTWICTPPSSPTRSSKAGGFQKTSSSGSSSARRRRASIRAAKATSKFSNGPARI